MGSRKRLVTEGAVAKEAAALDKTRQSVLDDVFNDLYQHRRRVYRVNFIRGMFFGMGSVLGGALIVMVIVWMASMFTEYPFISQILESLKNSIPN